MTAAEAIDAARRALGEPDAPCRALEQRIIERAHALEQHHVVRDHRVWIVVVERGEADHDELAIDCDDGTLLRVESFR
ncbi:MAG: hypothetical protein K1X88_22700 [Nannocystaceae bacterium]|nr:hypothetical protein [Nannocystaceae bacterium]